MSKTQPPAHKTTGKTKPSFEEQIPVIQEQIARRRPKWKIASMDFEDVSQTLFIRIWQKYHLFNPEVAPFEHWLNRVITNTLSNLYRDNLYKHARPCIQPPGCAFNDGDNRCTWTKSGLQCGECKLYRSWEERKKDKFFLGKPSDIEEHHYEISSRQSDFVDIEAKKKIVDEIMLTRLANSHEVMLYKMLYIEHLDPAVVGATLKYKSQSNSAIPGYQVILKFQKKVKKIAREIIEEEDLI